MCMPKSHVHIVSQTSRKFVCVNLLVYECLSLSPSPPLSVCFWMRKRVFKSISSMLSPPPGDVEFLSQLLHRHNAYRLACGRRGVIRVRGVYARAQSSTGTK